jgi:hypothetical protein
VLVFRDQHLDDEKLRDFAANFGRLEIGRAAAESRKRRLALPEIGDISNLDEEGRLRQREDRRRLDSLGNRLWHTDASYMSVPVVLGMLYAVAVPPASPLGGGETEFADMRAAYDALPEPMKDEIGGLIAEHDIFWSRGQIGFTDFLPGEREKYPPATPSAAPSRLEAQDVVPLGARFPHCRLARSRRPAPALRPNAVRDPARIRLQPQMAGRRSRNLGQPLHDASWPPA